MILKPFAVKPLALISPVGGNAKLNRGVVHLSYPQYAGMRWESGGNTNLWVRGQFDGTQSVDFCSLMACNAQAGTTIRLRLGTSQAQVNGTAPYDSGALPLIDPARIREDGLYHSHLEIGALQSASWWRIDLGNHAGDFSASALILGKKRQSDRYANHDREFGYQDLGTLEIARNGVVAETDGEVLRTLLFRLGWTTEAEYFEKWAPLVSAKGRRQIVYWCFDPQNHAYRQDKSFLGYFGRDPFIRGNDRAKDNSMDFQLQALL